MPEFSISSRNQVRRLSKRASYDRDVIHRIIDEALICHVGFVEEGQPFVIPTIHARSDETLLLHGAKASRLLKHVAAGNPICVVTTILDGIVFARSAFHHSLNYRSAVVFGRGHELDTPEDKLRALEIITNHVAPGRWAEARRPNARELEATTVVRVAIESASAKTRTGGPNDDEEDYDFPVWAGVLPLKQMTEPPIADSRLTSGIEPPEYVAKYRRTD
jgi:nitroimidazol reductase NimA-like FMN-containing flavoprotein (pyridoxamine 5'-phosphate oxidase superfamily)